MRQYVLHVSQTCFFHLRCICSVHRQLGCDVTAKLVTTLVPSCLDCNAVLPGLPATTLAPSTDNLACSSTYCSGPKAWRLCYSCFARVALVADHRENTVQAVPACAQDVRRHAPDYIASLLMPASDIPSRSSLRSSSNYDLVVPRTSQKMVTGLSLLPHPVLGIGCRPT